MNPFNTAFLKAPKRSRFDFSHTNSIGLQFGALTPSLSQFIVPGDEVSMSVEQLCRLAPMPVPTFVPLKLRHDFFFVPLRLLYGPEYLDKLFGSDVADLPRAYSDNMRYLRNSFSDHTVFADDEDSSIQIQRNTYGSPAVPGSLMDFLGYPVPNDEILGEDACRALAENNLVEYSTAINQGTPATNRIYNTFDSTPQVNVEKFFAYHFIWRDWYRFTGIQTNSVVEPFLSNGILQGVTNLDDSMDDRPLSSIPGIAPFVNESPQNKIFLAHLSQLKFAHFPKDMFMSVRYGQKPTVLIPTGSAGTIPALREASAVQRFLDIISITGQRYFDKVKGLFGVEPVGPKDDRVQFISRYQQFIKVGEVLTTASTSEAVTGDYAGRGILIDGKYLFKRRFTEHGWLFCITSVVPEIAYAGLHRELTDIYPIDSPVPSLAEVGDQTVFGRELWFQFTLGGYQSGSNNRSVGDQFRYYAYKSANNEVHSFFKLSTSMPWSPVYRPAISFANIVENSKVQPKVWNVMFNATDAPYLYGDRFYINLNFTEYITRALPKYINYHL